MIYSLRFFIFVIVSLLVPNLASTQMQLGIRTESKSGINGISLDPSATAYQKSKWDIHILGMGAFAQNNYAYLKNTSLTRLIWHADSPQIVFDRPGNETSTFEVDFSTGKRCRYFNASAYLAGPAISYKFNEDMSIGVFTSLHGFLNANQIPDIYSYYTIIDHPYFKPFEVGTYTMGGMTWADAGVNFSYKQKKSRTSYISYGGSMKVIRAYDHIFFKSNKNYFHTLTGKNSFRVKHGSFAASFSTQNLLQNPMGWGTSLDLGISIANGVLEENYQTKLGASITDLGFVIHKNARKLNSTFKDSLAIDGDSYANVSTLDQAADIFINLARSAGIDIANTSKITLPTATRINFFVDHRLSNKWYIYGLFSLPLAWTNDIRSGHFLAISPRYESTNFAVSMPVTMYHWRKPRLGLSARLWYLSIGSEHLPSIFRKSNFYGSDLYTSIKIPLGKIKKRVKKLGDC
jgi:hypothetical protein